MKLHFTRTTSIAMCVAMSSLQCAFAQGLLGEPYMTATLNDFVSHFRFKENSKAPGQFGLTDHIFTNASHELSLGLGVTADGKIVHLQFAMPRQLIDEPKLTLEGRDLAKSFLTAAMSGRDYMTFNPLMDEIAVRGLDLHPVPIAPNAKFNDSGRAVPHNAYKLGPGPVQKGDQLTFIDKMPALTKTPSAMYSAFSGGEKQAAAVAQSCRVAFLNKVSDNRPIFMADAWNEEFWQKNIEPKRARPAAAPAVAPNEAINHAIELLATKDPINARIALNDIDIAEKLKPDDYRIAALRALSQIQMGRRAKGLVALRDAIAKLPAGATFDAFRKEMQSVANDTDNRLKSAAPYTVPPEKRRYTIPPGTSAVIADRDESSGVITMSLSGGHDPDGGKQDGTDDGIIEVLNENINKPDDVHR